MLYERWREIARSHRNELALAEAGQGQRWTFGQLADLIETSEPTQGMIAYPRGVSAEFIVTILRAWQDNQVVCPLETTQNPPSIPSLPAGIVHLKTTSATTGAPRLIAFTAAQLMADADNIVHTMGLRRDWPNLGVISLAHSYGFSNLVTPLLLHGIPLILCKSGLPETVRRAAEVAPAITLPAVPALWRAWHDAGAIPSNVRLAISAGAPLPLPLEAEVFRAAGIKVHNFYGATECGGIAYDPTGTPRSDGACVGAPMKNVKLSVSDDGCLRIRSRAVGETYLPEPSPNLTSGWFQSNDLAELIDGQVFLRGRVSDQINVAGRKVSPESIERVLLTHPQVRDCLVFGVPSLDTGRTEIVVASIAPDGQVTFENLKQYLLDRIPAWQVPREWLFVESFETNQRGKLSRTEWRKKYLDQRK